MSRITKRALRPRLLAALALTLTLLPQPFSACNVETAGEAVRFATAAQGILSDGQPVGEFETAAGFTVELDTARVALGPIYFYGGEPMASAAPVFESLGGVARACPTHSQYDYGAVLGEVIEQYAVDLLAAEPTPTGEIDGEAGTCHSTEIHIHPPGDQQLPAGSPAADIEELEGASLLLEGMASKDGQSVPFRAALDIPDEGTMRVVQNIEADIEIEDLSVRPGAAVVQVLVDAWLDQVDFASLTETDANGRFLFSEGTQAKSALLQAVRNRYSYQLTWRDQ